MFGKYESIVILTLIFGFSVMLLDIFTLHADVSKALSDGALTWFMSLSFTIVLAYYRELTQRSR